MIFMVPMFLFTCTSFTLISHSSIPSTLFEQSCSLSVRPDSLLPSFASRINLWLLDAFIWFIDYMEMKQMSY